MILETLARGSSPDFKDHLADLTIGAITKRIERAGQKNEELEKAESTLAMLAFFKTLTKDSPRGLAALNDVLQFVDKSMKWKHNGKLPLILLQRSGILG